MSNALALPTSGDANTWTPQEYALAEAAGLVQKRGQQMVVVPRPTAEAFLHHCHRTGLDPVARQIYLIERGGKYTIQVSIDGARLVAQRSGEYGGQTPVQWTDGTRAMRPYLEDGKVVRDGQGNVIMVEDYVWHDVWLSKEHPLAARVGVYRQGFPEPIYAVANWDAYSAGGPMWKKMPALMLGKCAEMLALRKAFPQDLSGLYSAEEMDQAGAGAPVGRGGEQPAPQPQAPELKHDADMAAEWVEAVKKAPTKDALRALYEEAKDKDLLDLAVPHPAPQPGFPDEIALGAYIIGMAKRAPEVGDDGVVDAEVVPDDEPGDLLAQAQAKISTDA